MATEIGPTSGRFFRLGLNLLRLGPRAGLLPAIALMLVCVSAIPAQSQRGDGQAYPRPDWGQVPPSQADSPYAGTNSNPAMEAKRLEALNAERQKSMIADTDKLVKLAAELDGEVKGKNPGELTPDQLRTVAKIEKLARSVREKMATSVRPVPAMVEPPILPSTR